jgi:photosystem II stability/assembly factor-like uncharacterized protein
MRGIRSRRPLWLLAVAVAVVLVQGVAAGSAPAQSGPPSHGALRDSPNLRLRATNEWYGDGRIPLDSRSGPFSASYQRFLERTAARVRAVPSAALHASGTPTWVNLGPTRATFATNYYTLHVTDSGRPRSIIVHGSTIYVASAMGGVWKSTDSGSTWAPITDGLPSLSDGSLAMDPNNASTLYLGLGDPFDGTGIGLVKSTDGGATWSSPVFLGNETTIPDVVVDPSNSNVVLAATDDGLYRSTDAGASFSQVSIATGDTGAPKVWSIAPTAAHDFVLSLEGNPTATSGTTDGQIWTSSDDGASWSRATGVTKASGVGRITVAAAPSNPSIVYALAAIPNATSSADLADIFKSTDGGQSWTALNANTRQYTNPNSESANVDGLMNGQGWYDQAVAVDPSDPNTVFFGGSLLIAKTTDGGATFTQISNWLGQFGLPYVHADCHTATFDANGNLYIGTDGGIAKSTDGGATFDSSLNVGLVDQLPYTVSSSPASADAVLGGFQDLGTRLREGSTSTFDQVIGGDGIGSDINRSNASLMLGSIYYDHFYKSTDGGSTWADASTGISEVDNGNSAPFYSRLVPWAGDVTGNTLYTFSNTKVYKTTSYAASWSPLPNPVTSSGAIREIGVSPSDANDVGAVASGGRVFLSSDGGSTWTQAASLPNNQLSLSYISYDPTNPSTIYVASVAPVQNASHLWVSTDGGSSWTSLDGYGGSANGFPTGVPVNFVKVDPLSSSTLYAGTQLGLYRSTDGGATWSRFGTGLPLVSVTDLYIAPDDGVIRAASYGRGFWELTYPTANDFSIGATRSTLSAAQGGSDGTTITTAVTSGTAESVALAASGLPAGATATFIPPSVTAGASSALTLSAGATTPPGSYDVTVTGTSASAVHSVHVTFDVVGPHTLAVARAGTGTGTVSSTPAGISCGATCSHAFADGTVVSLTPAPATGSVFAGWSGACSGTGACSVTMTQDAAVTATFTLVSHTLTVARSGSGSGSVVSSPAGISCGATCAASFAYGSTVTLTASPGPGSTFTGWSGACSGTGTCTVTVLSDTSVGAGFAAKPPQARCLVPNVKGKTLAAARAAIVAARCAVGHVTRAASKKIPKGHVIAQSPAPGKHLKRGSKVNLVVSRGKH